MKKRIFILAAAAIIICAVIITDFIKYGYLEYMLDSRKIDRASENYSDVVTLLIGPHVLIKKPYVEIVQIKSDKTVTVNTFRVIRGSNNRDYTDKIIKGETRTLSDDEYNTLLEILRNSDFESTQNEIENDISWVDGYSTYLIVRAGNDFDIVGGHCADGKDECFKNIMDYILGLLE